MTRKEFVERMQKDHHLKTKGVTACPPGVADGAFRAHDATVRRTHGHGRGVTQQAMRIACPAETRAADMRPKL